MPTTLQHFLAMGGYAAYVWPAFGITFAVLLCNLILPYWQQRKLLKMKRQ